MKTHNNTDTSDGSSDDPPDDSPESADSSAEPHNSREQSLSPEPAPHKPVNPHLRYHKESPKVARAFMEFWRSVKKPSAIPEKYKELMQLAIVLTQYCKPCIEQHVKICLDAGCTRAEIIDAANVALAMGGGGVYEYIGYLFESLDRNAPETDKKS